MYPRAWKAVYPPLLNSLRRLHGRVQARPNMCAALNTAFSVMTRSITAPIATSESPTFGILTKDSITPRILDGSTPSTPCNACLQPCRLTHKIQPAKASTRNRFCVHSSDAWCHKFDWPENACGDPQWHRILEACRTGARYARRRTNTRCNRKYSQIIPVAWDKMHNTPPRGQHMASMDSTYVFAMQNDCNLVLFKKGSEGRYEWMQCGPASPTTATCSPATAHWSFNLWWPW